MAVNQVFKKLSKYYHENKLSHVYLLETNDEEKCLSDLLELIKEMSCLNNYKSDCNACNICHLIDENGFPDVMIVRPDGKNIKKEQVLEIQKRFCYKPLLSKINAYIIMETEKLNGSSANTMLKFIEEPFENCYGFFITNNKENVLLTVQSRCECELVKYDDEISINGEIKDILMPIIKKYLYNIEVNKKYSIIYNKEIVSNNVIKDNIELFFKIILNVYNAYFYDKMNLTSDIELYKEFDFLKNNSIISLENKIKLIMNLLNNLNYNLNYELMLDRFVIEMGENNG